MNERAEHMRRIVEVAEKNMRPVAEMIAADHAPLFSLTRKDSVAELVDDITLCLVTIYQKGVERQIEAVAQQRAEAAAVLLEVISAAVEWREHGSGARQANDYIRGHKPPGPDGANKADVRLLAAINAWTPRGDER